MREMAVLVLVFSFVAGCGCDDEDGAAVDDAGTDSGHASMDSATDEDVGTTAEGGMDVRNGQQIDAGLDVIVSQPPPTLQDLNGTWFGPCYEYDGERVSITLIFADGTMNFQLGFYNNSVCQNRVMFIDTEMEVSIPDPPESPQNPGAYRLAVEVKTVTCTVTNEEALDIANDVEIFGYSDWELNEPKTIDGRDFAPSDDDAGTGGDYLPDIGDQGEFLFRLNIYGDQLLISDLGAGSLPDDVYSKR